MAGGDPAADAVARDNLVVILSVKSGRFRLGKKVKSALATYLSQTLELETLEEIGVRGQIVQSDLSEEWQRGWSSWPSAIAGGVTRAAHAAT